MAHKILQPILNHLRAKHLVPRMKPIVGIILHDTAGSGSHNDTLYLANPGDGRKVSCDFTVERDGSIWKLNPDLNRYATLHAGRATNYKNLRNSEVTKSTIGIEITQHHDLSTWKFKGRPIYTPEQVESVARLCAWLVQEYKLAPSDITTHRAVITDGSRSDPRQFPFDGEHGFWHHYWTVQGQGDVYLASLDIKKTPEPTGKQHVVTKGQGFYAIARIHKMKPEELARINGLNFESVLVPGQVLKLKG